MSKHHHRGRPLAVVALGGNALLRRGEPLDIGTEQRNIDMAVHALAAVADDHDMVITHGNGPQVGWLALQSAAQQSHADPQDVLGAETEGAIGYLLGQGLRNVLPGRDVAVLLTQVIVDANDVAFGRPTKPIGPLYEEHEAHLLAAQQGWSIARDGSGFRRVVASPEPQRIVEIEQIRLLLEAGVIVVCAAGGGIPVVVDEKRGLRGVDAVIDKDLSAAALACQLGVDVLLILTDVTAVQRGWGTPHSAPIACITPDELATLSFAPGSMQPKVLAASRFVSGTGRRAAIGALGDAAAILRGEAGTTVRGRC